MKTGVGLMAFGTMFSLLLGSWVEIVDEQPVSSGMGTGMGEASW